MKTVTSTSIQDVIAQLIREADEKAIQSERVVHRMEVGRVLRQGDIYIHRVADDHPHGKEIARGKIQLALGQSVGQRHFLVGDLVAYEGTKPPPTCKPDIMLGPCVVVRKRAANTHPEHAHASLPPGTYQIEHQLNWRTRQRVQD